MTDSDRSKRTRTRPVMASNTSYICKCFLMKSWSSKYATLQVPNTADVS